MATDDQGPAGAEALAHRHGPVPVQTRSERPRSTSRDDFAAVTGREIEWKYTPVDRLRTLLEGDLEGGEYPIEADAGEGIAIGWMPAAEVTRGATGIPEDRASANAWQSVQRVLAIDVAADASARATVRRASLGSQARAAHTLVTVGRGAHAVIVLENTGSAHLSENIEFSIADDATATVVTVQRWDDEAIHLASHFAKVGKGATFPHIAVSLGGSVVRVNPSTHLAGEGAEAELLGIYFCDAGQHIEQQVYVHHDAPRSRSRVTYKGALSGQGAHSVWVGDVLIAPSAAGTDSYEQNRNLVLSEGTRADSVPNLEIETGDIAGAGHASATGRFDEEQLFYLRSRGVPEKEARRLVVLGFLVEVLARIPDDTLRDELIAAIERELEAAA